MIEGSEFNNNISVMKEKMFLGIITYVSLVYAIFYTSQFQILYTSILFTYLGYLLDFLVVALSMFHIFQRRYTRSQFIMVIIMIILIPIFIGVRNLVFARLILFGLVFIAINDLDKTLRIYLAALITGVTLVILFSILGVFDFKYDSASFVLGFRNPNTPGAYVLLITVLLWSQFSDSKLIKLFSFIITLVISLLVDNKTTILILIIVPFTFYLVKNRNKIIRYIVILVPFLIVSLQYFLGKNLYSREIFIWIDHMMSGRLWIWHYYIDNVPITPMGIDVYKLLGERIEFIPGKGIFDGGFLYYMIINGYVSTIIFMILISWSIYVLYKDGKFSLVALQVLLVLVSFSENSILIWIQSPSVMIASYVIFDKLKRGRIDLN